MRYIPINGEPDGGDEIDPRRRMFAGMFNQPQIQMGDQQPIMMDAPQIEGDAQTLFLNPRRGEADSTGKPVKAPVKTAPVAPVAMQDIGAAGDGMDIMTGAAPQHAAPQHSVGTAATASAKKGFGSGLFGKVMGKIGLSGA